MFGSNILNTRKCSLLLAGVLLIFGMAAQTPAGAQDLRDLVDRIDRLENSLQEVRGHVFGGRPAPTAPQVAAPQRGAAPTGGGAARNAANIDAAGLTVKLADLEQEIRELTGRLEQAEHENRQLRGRIDGLVADTDHRLNRVETNRVENGVSGNGGTVVQDPAGGDAIGTGRNAKTKVLGTIPANGSAPAPVVSAPVPTPKPGAGGGAAEPVAPPKVAAVKTGTVSAGPAAAPVAPGSAKGQYDAAFALLRARRFAEAEAGFRQLIADHPKDKLTGNAQYWIGETHYARKDYEAAAAAFLTGYKKYRSSSKGPDNLLKLGITLTILEQKGDACAVLDELKTRYPKASPSIIRRMKRERKKAGC